MQKSKELRGKTPGRSQTFEEAPDFKNTFDCPECGNELDESLKFCPNCGSKVEIPEDQINFCTECGAKIMDGAKFCHECGNTLFEDEAGELAESDVKLISGEIDEEVIELPESDVQLISGEDVIELPEGGCDSIREDDE